jgi:hypothetical protein
MAAEPNEAWVEAEAWLRARIKEKEVEILLLDAQRTRDKGDRYPHDTEKRRVEAVRQLLALYQSPPVDNRVRIFLEEVWRGFLLHPDPAAAATEFLKGKPRRGRRANSEERNLRIAREVQKSVDAGRTVAEACETVRLKHAPGIGSWERIRAIYYGPAVDEEAKKVWRFAIGARQPGVTEMLSAIEPVVRAVLAVTDQNPELWLDFLVNSLRFEVNDPGRSMP